MPRTTKAMLEEDVRILRSENRRLRAEVWHFKEVYEILEGKNFSIGEFCRMHEGAISAIAHVVSDLRSILLSRK